jgi:hypothetical protein
MAASWARQSKPVCHQPTSSRRNAGLVPSSQPGPSSASGQRARASRSARSSSTACETSTVNGSMLTGTSRVDHQLPQPGLTPSCSAAGPQQVATHPSTALTLPKAGHEPIPTPPLVTDTQSQALRNRPVCVNGGSALSGRPSPPWLLRRGVNGGLGLSMQASGGWADLPATTRPPQRCSRGRRDADSLRPASKTVLVAAELTAGPVGYTNLRSFSFGCHSRWWQSPGPRPCPGGSATMACRPVRHPRLSQLAC